MREQDTRRGLWIMVLVTVIFSLQDGITKHLGASYPIPMFVMLRFWAFAAAAIVISSRRAGGFRAAVATRHPVVQGLRGVVVAAQICMSSYAFTHLGLIPTHAVLVCAPLMVAALSGPVLGEHVGWRRWAAIGVGGIGVLIILRPDTTVFTPLSLLPLAAAFLWSLYALATRYVSRHDAPAVSFLWMGLAGAAAITGPGLWLWVPMSDGDWVWMLALCCTSVTGHYLLIRAYDMAEASALQPLTYLTLVFISVFAVFLFGEVLLPNVVIGAAVVVAAGLFTLWRQQVAARAAVMRH